jgi:enamine deaminase RidA (YjgF/YER057c/UK114 family)
MGARQSIHTSTLSHLTAIPLASRIGPLLMSSIIAPFDPGTRNVPEKVEDQLANIFTHVNAMLEAAGAGWQHIAKMNFWVPSAEDRPKLEPLWIERFPDPASRPARHTQIAPQLQAAHADFTAYVID